MLTLIIIISVLYIMVKFIGISLKAIICLIGALICMVLIGTGVGAVIGVPVLIAIGRTFLRGMK